MPMIRSHALLLLAAAIWGFAFVAQRAGMEHVGPFTFNGVRFALGALVMLPFVRRNTSEAQQHERIFPTKISPVRGALLTGLVLFAGASFQQAGIVSTTAGKAGFITGLYVVLVPLLGCAWGRRTGALAWLGAGAAVTGLYLLTATEAASVGKGDLLVLASAFFWAFHVLLVGQFSARIGAARLAFAQYATCSVLSLTIAIVSEPISSSELAAAVLPILYAGLFSVGLAYTLQVVAQRRAHPTHAAIILSLEAVFAVFGGWILLGEIVETRGLLGCGLMLIGMMLAQIDAGRRAPHLTS
jgi:drug/metabolite transporter (DMT)-like permease